MRVPLPLFLTTLLIGIAAAIPTTAATISSSPPSSGESDSGLPSPPANLSAQFVISELIFPTNDSAKISRARQLLGNYVNNVKRNEPGVRIFEVTYIRKKNTFLTYEVYDNFSIWESHLQTPYLGALIATVKKEELSNKRGVVDVLEEDFIYVRDEIGPV